MKPMQTRKVLALLLIFTLCLTGWTYWHDDHVSEVADLVQPVSRSAPDDQKSASPDMATEKRVDWSAEGRLNGATEAVSDIDPFRAKSWYIPPPPQPEQPPPKPSAPPLRFKYMGRSEAADGSGVVTIYLSKDNDFFTVRPGDVFDTYYRFESLEHGQLLLTYLPLNTTQRLATGNTE